VAAVESIESRVRRGGVTEETSPPSGFAQLDRFLVPVQGAKSLQDARSTFDCILPHPADELPNQPLWAAPRAQLAALSEADTSLRDLCPSLNVNYRAALEVEVRAGPGRHRLQQGF
jgi:hypothetical protein